MVNQNGVLTGIKLGRIEDPFKKKEGESSKKIATGASTTGGKKGKESSVNAVNPGHQGSQQYAMSFTTALSTVPVYAPPPMNYQP
ncbi:hypothetical protein CRG98_001145 [Punica granatum]|uniref:Uncharacterized protein n=1 Tax=Punica granatum TaxID=22663 RepID=A0A2I0LCV0_PUNGR|nr:hypothetical protein CRG98_001145 [Punica granatum]